MKAIIILLLSTVLVLSQTREPIQHQFSYHNGITNVIEYLSGTTPYFQLNNFMFGWHWGGERKISQVMKVNQNDMCTIGGNIKDYFYNDSTNLFIRSSYGDKYLYTHCYWDDNIVFTKSLCYDPCLEIDSTNVFKLNKQNDNQNLIFGFIKKTGGTSTLYGDNNYRYKITTSTSVGTTVLDKPWMNNLLTYVEGNENPIYSKDDTTYQDTIIRQNEANIRKGINEKFAGKIFYVSLNLRRLGPNILQDTMPVLKIEIPYTYQDTNNINYNKKALFDSIPSNLVNNYYSLPDNRGNVYKLKSAGIDGTTELIIRRNMLPLINNDNGDITISGYINFGNTQLGNNKIKSNLGNPEKFRIDTLGIKVTYLGNCDIAIDWIKFETENTKNLVRGYYDSLIIYGIQNDLTNLTDISFRSRGIKPMRFTINVEGSPINWESERYFRKLVGDIITGSNEAILSNHYDYYINPADKWLSYCKITPHISNPFNGSDKINYQYDSLYWKTSGLSTGYKVKAFSNKLNNLFESEWETFLRYDSNKTTLQLVEEMRELTFNEYFHSEKLAYAGGPMSIQAYWEFLQFDRLVNKYKSGFQYSDLPWFAQSFVEGFVYKAPVGNGQICYTINSPNGTRVVTGEEFRLMNWNPIILGAKGLFYDGDADVAEDSTTHPNLRLLPSEKILMERMNADPVYAVDSLEFYNMNDELFINHPKSTSDFLDTTYNHLNLYHKNYNLQTVAGTMDVPVNRIFVGKRSVRNEMYRLHKWVKSNENTLMNLRLQAWYGKGYKIWTNQHPRWDTSSNIIDKYIYLDSIKTIKLYRVDATGYTNEKVVESTYESFLDLTILADKNDSNMTKTFYLGLQNRRTDPLILVNDTIDYTYFDEEGSYTNYVLINTKPKFYTTAEIDNKCKFGAYLIIPDDYEDEYGGNYVYYPVFKDTTYWRDLFWKRLGSREISIPFKIGDSSYKKLRVIELIDTSDIFKKAPYYTALDTVIPTNGTISVRFLPGEGKIFKVSNFEEDEEPFTGELAFSNQHKLVVYPTKQTSNINFNGKDTMVYYHAVYHKRNDLTGKNSVYYRRSFPYNANGYDQILWEKEEKLISTKLVVKREIEPNLNVDSVEVDSCNCKYPSIVVRYDAIDSTQKAYIVYNCEQIPIVDTQKVYVVETVIDCDEPYSAIMPSQLIYPIGFAYSNQGNEFAMNTWGVPVVNASANGNFYTWADSIFGIVAGYKTPNDRGYITNKKYIKYDYTEGIKSIQPSLNPYSRIANAENDCALVWAEVKPASMMQFVDSTSIHYTMLKLDGNGDIDNSVPNGILDPSQPRFASVQTNGFGSARIDVRKRGISSYPTVVRPVQYYLRPTREMQDSIHYFTSTWDRVYWEYNPNIFLLRPFINQKMLDINKSSNLWNCLGPYSIFGAQKSLYSPNVMQGTIRNNFTGAGFHQIVGNDSSFVLGFSSQSSTAGIDIANSDIWLFPHGFWNIYYDPIIDWGNIDTVLTPGDPNLWVMNRGKGIYPQLTKSPIVNKTTDWKINSLIFQSVNDSIFSTKQYFYRRNTEDERMKIHPIMSFVGNDGVDESGISFFELNNFNKPNIKFMGRKNDKYEYLDTIQTEWFRIENIEELSFISQNTKNSTAKILIERRKDGKKIEMNPKIFSNSKTSKNRIHLINGKNEQYRILFAKKDNNYKLNLGFMLAKDSELNPDEELIDADRVGKSTITELEDYVDLGDESYLGGIESGIKINLYPNPANDRIYVSAYLPLEYIKSNKLENNQLKLIIVNSIGKEIYKSDINAGETKAIETSTYSNGIYFVKITKPNSDLQIQNKMFVIER